MEGMLNTATAFLTAAGEPAGGAEMGQVIGATAGAVVATGALLFAVSRHRARPGSALGRAAARVERLFGLPGWAALPSVMSAASLLVALLGMYWDIALHIGEGRDAGPLANPAHYLILAGLFGVFSAGAVAIALPVDERPGPAPVRIAPGWYAPVGGLLMAICGGYALIAFPLDDVWHRLFGQDVTLWGPTHLMLIGGAGMTLIGQAVLLAEGMHDRRRGAGGPGHSGRVVTWLRRTAVMGGLLIGLSTFQAEFDFGVPQFRLVFQPLLVALAAGVALVAARVWIGRGAALGTAIFFLAVRGGVSLLVGPAFGEITPSLPLYLAEAACVEVVALVLGRDRPLTLGVVGGLLVGTIGFAAEWGWSKVAMDLSWNGALMPEGLLMAVGGGLAGGVLGALLGAGLHGELPRPSVARPLFAGAIAAVALLVANGLVTETARDLRPQVALTDVGSGDERKALLDVRFDPPSAVEDAEWLAATAWQGGGLVVDDLRRVGAGRYRSTEPLPVAGEWKALIRLHRDRWMLGVPVYLPGDPAIPAKEVPASARFSRGFVDETEILQRELKDDVPGWLWPAASLAVLALSLGFILSLAWGVQRVAGRRDPTLPAEGRRGAGVGSPRPVGA